MHQGKSHLAFSYAAVDIRAKPEETVYSPSPVKIDQIITRDKTIPKSYKKARSGPHWDDWKPAFEKQMYDLESRNVWELVTPLPKDRILPGKWVLD